MSTLADVIWTHVTQLCLIMEQENNIHSPLVSRNVFFEWHCHTKASQKKSKTSIQGTGLI